MPRKEKIKEISKEMLATTVKVNQQDEDEYQLRCLRRDLENRKSPQKQAALKCIAAVSGLNIQQSCGYKIPLLDVLTRTTDTDILNAALGKFPKEQQIYAAAAMGLASKLPQLIAQAGNIDTPLPSGETALYLAAKYGQVFTAEMLLDAGAAANPKTELYELIAQDKAIPLGVRINAGVNPHIVSPLYAATEGRHHETMQLLIRRGADIHRFSPYGFALQLSLQCTHMLRNKLRYDDHINVYSAMHVAAFNNDPVALGILLEHGAAVDYAPVFEVQDRSFLILCPPKKVHYGSTPLHCAATAGASRAVDYLLHAKANVHHIGCDLLPERLNGIVDDETIGMMPIHCAAATGKGDVVKILLDHGAFINCSLRVNCDNSYYDYVGNTPFELAYPCEERSALKMLLSRGARIDNWAIYMGSATAHKDVEKMTLLLEHRDKKVKDLSKYLHTAVVNGHVPSVKLLISKGAVVTSALLTLARDCMHNEVVSVLEDAIRKQPIQVSQTMIGRLRSMFKASPPRPEDDDNDPLPVAKVG